MKFSIKDLTLEEKIRLLTGKNFWELENANGKLPRLRVSDGPHGVNKIIDGKPQTATAMPSLMAIANSWDENLARLDGEIIADECINAKCFNDVPIPLLCTPSIYDFANTPVR